MKKWWKCLMVVAVYGGLAGLSTAEAAENKVTIVGSTTVGPIVKAFAEYYMHLHKGVDVTVKESGSGDGAKALVHGACNIAAMSRFMKPKEFKAAVYGGVYPVFHVVAMDGIAVIVHPSNPVRGLSVQQIRDIYAGKITNWREVGGPNKKIVRISRDTNSGTFETFGKLVMKKKKIATGTEHVGSNGAVRQRVQTTPAAIGYVGFGFVDRTVKALEINRVRATRTTIASGHYPIARPLFMVTNGYPRLGSHVHALVTMHLSRKGQEIIEAIGFVPVTSYK